MNLLNKKARKILLDYVRSNFEMIEVEPGACAMNWQCHRNTVHEAIQNNDEEIVMVFQIDCDQPILHFVNYRDGRFIDNTLGHWSSKMFFYKIRSIKRAELWDTLMIFDSYRASLGRILPWYVRLFSNYRS